MHKYLKSIGFRGIDHDDLKILKEDVQAHPDMQSLSTSLDNERIMEYRKDYSYHLGLALVGQEDPEDGFESDYFYPYFIGSSISSNEDLVEIVKNSERNSYEGVLNDPRLGIDLIFFLTDDIALIEEDSRSGQPVNHGSIRLSGLAERAVVLLPLEESMKPESNPREAEGYDDLKEAVGEDSSDAEELFSVRDLQLTMSAYGRIEKEDILTVVSTYIMPNGIECDKYSVLGEILDCKKFMNEATRQTIFVITLDCNGVRMDVVVNTADLIGEPMVKRRLQADIWLQGSIT